MSAGAILYPNVTSLPSRTNIDKADKHPGKPDGVKGEFDKVFEKVIDKSGNVGDTNAADLNQIRATLKFSAHATQRLSERKIVMDAKQMAKVNDAVDKAEAKGLDDALVLTHDAAFIVNVKNRTVITALDRNSLAGNVFTNIDGAVMA